MKNLLWDKQAITELGEPIIWNDAQEWYIMTDNKQLAGFLAVTPYNNHYKINYWYVLPEYRGKNIAHKLYHEFIKYNFGKLKIKAVATKMSLPIFQKFGFEVTKSFKNYFNVEL